MIFMLLKCSRTAGVMTGGLGAAVTPSETITPNSWDLSVIYDTVWKKKINKMMKVDGWLPLDRQLSCCRERRRRGCPSGVGREAGTETALHRG